MNEKKRKQKQYYVNQAKRAKLEKRKLHPGLRGFLCTTNNKERECIREAYNLLNEHANELYGVENDCQESSGASGADVEQSLAAELAALKEERVSKERRFQLVDSGAKNCIFISTQLERTAPLVERIARQVRDSGVQRTRYLLRLLPVQVVCRATEADIRASAEAMIKEAFTEIGVTYTTVFRSRNQAKLPQTDAQTAINDLIEAVCPTARLNHKTPQLTVVMEVIRNIICLGVVRDFYEMKKYNLVELARASGEGENKGEGGEEAGGAGGEGQKSPPCEGEKSEAGDSGDGVLRDSADAAVEGGESVQAEEAEAGTTAEVRGSPEPSAARGSPEPAAANGSPKSEVRGSPEPSAARGGQEPAAANGNPQPAVSGSPEPAPASRGSPEPALADPALGPDAEGGAATADKPVAEAP